MTGHSGEFMRGEWGVGRGEGFFYHLFFVVFSLSFYFSLVLLFFVVLLLFSLFILFSFHFVFFLFSFSF